MLALGVVARRPRRPPPRLARPAVADRLDPLAAAGRRDRRLPRPHAAAARRLSDGDRRRLRRPPRGRDRPVPPAPPPPLGVGRRARQQGSARLALEDADLLRPRRRRQPRRPADLGGPLPAAGRPPRPGDARLLPRRPRAPRLEPARRARRDGAGRARPDGRPHGRPPVLQPDLGLRHDGPGPRPLLASRRRPREARQPGDDRPARAVPRDRRLRLPARASDPPVRAARLQLALPARAPQAGRGHPEADRLGDGPHPRARTGRDPGARRPARRPGARRAREALDRVRGDRQPQRLALSLGRRRRRLLPAEPVPLGRVLRVARDRRPRDADRRRASPCGGFRAAWPSA